MCKATQATQNNKLTSLRHMLFIQKHKGISHPRRSTYKTYWRLQHQNILIYIHVTDKTTKSEFNDGKSVYHTRASLPRRPSATADNSLIVLQPQSHWNERRVHCMSASSQFYNSSFSHGPWHYWYPFPFLNEMIHDIAFSHTTNRYQCTLCKSTLYTISGHCQRYFKNQSSRLSSCPAAQSAGTHQQRLHTTTKTFPLWTL